MILAQAIRDLRCLYYMAPALSVKLLASLMPITQSVRGEQPVLKTHVHMRRDAAEQLWKELRRVDWQQIEPCWGASAKP